MSGEQSQMTAEELAFAGPGALAAMSGRER
jgi:hypothetical protein